MVDAAQERVESHRVGRLALSIVAVIVVLAVLSPNLAPAPLTTRLDTLVRPVRDAVGLDGVWNVFAPGPRTYVLGLAARLEYADGSVRIWRPPTGDLVAGGYRYYHWQKWMEQVNDPSWKQLWRPLSVWLARTRMVGGAPPTTITLVRLTRDLLPPGSHAARPRWNARPFYTYQVDPRDIR